MYLLLQALNNLSTGMKILGFPFLARPPEQHEYSGISSHPGFHTTKDMDMAAAYALGKVYEFNTVELDDEVHAVTDYPVVVGLNMEGYNKEVDYDAEKVVKESLTIFLDEVITHLENAYEEYTDDDIYYAIQYIAEQSDMSGEPVFGKSPVDLLGEERFSHFTDPGGAVLDLEDPVQLVKQYMQTKEIPKDFLMDVTNQYRYLDDVPHSKVVAVWYATPVAVDMTDVVNGEDEFAAEISKKWPGFIVLDYDDVYSGMMQTDFTKVWEREDVEESLMEYHGTTYLRLLQAVPEFTSQLPPPPSPPYTT